jgi:hypothetical protein
VIAKLGVVIEPDDDMVMLAARALGFDADQFSRHAQMKHPDNAAGYVQQDIFGRPYDVLDSPTGKTVQCAAIHGHAQARF